MDFDLSDEAISAHAKDFGLKFPVARDPRGAIAAKLGARVTPEAFVIDSKGRVRYRGRIDDQFAGRGKRNANSTARDLHDAIAAVLAGREVAREHVEAVGCPIPEPPKEKATATPTYFKDVAPILQRHCQECHRKGQVGPFALETFEQARKRADDIAGGGRGPADAPVEADARGRPEVQARPFARPGRDRHAGRMGRGGDARRAIPRRPRRPPRSPKAGSSGPPTS